MCSQGNVLCLLQCLGLQEGEARLPDGCDIRKVREASGLHRDVEDDGVLCELVEVWYRLHQDRGGGGDTGELTSTDGLENRKKRVGILANREDLDVVNSAMTAVVCMATCLWLLLGNNGRRVALLQ